MSTYWRISNHADLNGAGGEKFASRWTTLGRRIVHLAESPAGAMLEVLVHLEFADGELPERYQLLEIHVPDELPVQELKPNAESDWKTVVEVTRAIGDEWLGSGQSALARVPSVIMPRTWNILLNPLHSNAAQVRIVSATRERFDNRLFGFGGH